MAKKPEVERPARPDDLVRYTGVMTRSDRGRFKAICARLGLDMERVGPAWIMERVALEERKLAR